MKRDEHSVGRFEVSRRRCLMAVPPVLMGLAGTSRLTAALSPSDTLDATTAVESEASYTPESQQAGRKAIEWLRKTQNGDGGCGVDIGQASDIGCSAMVGLALMADGVTPIEGRGQGMLRNIGRYIQRQTDNMPPDDITSTTGTQLQGKIGRHAHSFFATLFLSQIIGHGTNPDTVKRSLKRVVSAIVRSQGPKGDWGNQSWAPVLGTVMGWVSLRAADFAGVSVGAAPEKTAEYLIKTMQHNLTSQRGWMHELYKNASGVRVLYSMQREEEDIAKKAFQAALQLVSKDNTPFTQAGGEEFLAFHLITETMLKKGGKDWNTWFSTVRDKLINVQNRDGSWTGHHCITSRTFCTAAAVLVLTSPYRYLPISQA